jgi:ubiquinone/menaquinone biosynthesis C-methylase UbiE
MSQMRFDASTVAKAARRNQSPYWGEHVARYLFAAPYVAGCSVLDIACGTGYGLPVLHQRARLVVGGDIEFSAAQKAQAEIDKQRAMIVVSDGCMLPFADASFDAITSFETLEHLEARSQFLSELQRVLAPNGLCIISTPNANYTEPINGKPRNPHHVFEYTPEELIAELGCYFNSIELFGQNLDARFAISPFWDDQQKLPRTVRVQSQLFLWRVLNKLPFSSMRDRLSSALWGHAFYPGDTDYQFDGSTVESAHVLVALCRASVSVR